MKKILISEDDPVTRTILKTLLSGEYEVIETSNGFEALEKFEGVDLIICDLNMPNMSGLEVAEKLVGKNIPFLMLTVEHDQGIIEKAKKLGITGWLTKPFAPNLLLQSVKKILLEI
ncbi:MAG: response regulator [Spirochaetia bacterium]|nr:response regulator [Spirochaetia bacterium]